MNTQKRKAAPLLAAAMLYALVLSGCGSKETSTFAGGSGTKEDPWQIATVEQLGKVRDDLTKSYVLTADLDLKSEAFAPIGTFESKSDAEEDGNVENCTASGSVKASDGCYSVAGLAGCFQNSAYAKNCTAKDITITVGKNASLVGGLTGHAGTTEGNPTAITGCKVENVSIQAGGTAQRIGGVIGGGFYMAQFAQYYAEPLPFRVSSCTVSGVKLTGGKLVGSIAGYIYSNSTADGSVTDVTWNGAALEAKAGADSSTPVSELS